MAGPQKIKLLYDPVIPLLGLYPKEVKTRAWIDICKSMVIAALYTRAKNVEATQVSRWMGKQNVVLHNGIDSL